MNHFDMELTQRQANEYRKGTKKEKGTIIDQYCGLTNVSRNLASKRFRAVMRDIHPCVLRIRNKLGKRRGRKPTYWGIHRAIVRKAWELAGEICGERLHPAIAGFIEQLVANGDLKYYGIRYIGETKGMSERTLKRIIATFPKTGAGKSHKGNAAIYKAIPINAHFGTNTTKAGYIEVDYVEHNGGNASGTFAQTGCYVDICLGWIARSAAIGKNMHAVRTIHETNQKKFFHRIHEYHPDNAKPILALLLEKTLCTKPAGYAISRSRPYHKEDNGHVEQKNGDKVRKLVGYHRYDTEEQVVVLNRLYTIEDMISNFFLPSQKLLEKVQDDKGRVIRRRYDGAQTACQRLLVAANVSQQVKERIRKQYRQLNLISLRKESQALQQQLLQTVISRK